MDALSVKPGLFIWQLINFAVLMIILGKFAIPAIMKSLKEREEGIQNNINEAKKINADAIEALKVSQTKIDEAYKEVSAIVSKGKEQANIIIQNATAEADSIKKQKLEEAIREIENNKNAAITQLRNEVAGLVVDATEQILNSKLDRETHTKLVNDYIKNIKQN
ncbi:MAG: F0F1 ATP synthase subunit B [Candidatus Kapaibacteriota bacterium]|jgi:F-type H+-transporting ATPase subunit b